MIVCANNPPHNGFLLAVCTTTFLHFFSCAMAPSYLCTGTFLGSPSLSFLSPCSLAALHPAARTASISSSHLYPRDLARLAFPVSAHALRTLGTLMTRTFSDRETAPSESVPSILLHVIPTCCTRDFHCRMRWHSLSLEFMSCTAPFIFLGCALFLPCFTCFHITLVHPFQFTLCQMSH
jgi:hypothetical protein